MYGSQLIAVQTNLTKDITPGVSDSTERDVSATSTDSIPNPTPQTSFIPMSSKNMMPDAIKTSKMLTMGKKDKSGTNE